MFDVAPTEMLVLAIIALLVIGPKDLPKAMRFVGKWVGKARGMARHFRSGLDTMMREAELEEMEAKWRAHNEEIMRAYPDISSAPPTANGNPPQMLPAPLVGPPAPAASPVAAEAASADSAAAASNPAQDAA